MAEYENSLDNKFIGGTSSADSIFNTGNKVTINALAGNDSIQNGEVILIDSVNYKYSINGGSNISIDSGAGNDYIKNNGGNKIKIEGSEGNDSVENYGGSNSSINGGSGNDRIYNGFQLLISLTRKPPGYVLSSDEILLPDKNMLTGGDGEDYIINYGSNVTIMGGAGNDTIRSTELNTIYSTSNIKIDGGDGDDSIESEGGDNSTINGGDGSDYIWSNGDSVIINGGFGNDTLLGGYKITGGTGNDSIRGCGNVSIYAGIGNDTVYITSGNNALINAGKEDDLISLNSALNYSAKNNLIQYSNGDGKDTIYGFDADDTFQILTDSEIKANINGNDVIFKVGDTEEAITLKDVFSNDSATIKVLSKNGELTTYTCNKNGTITDNSGSITLSSPFSGTFDASDYTNVDASNNDLQVKIIGGKENSVTLSGGKANDSIENFTAKSSLLVGKGNDTIYNKTSYTEEKTRTVNKYETVYVDDGYTTQEPETIMASQRLVQFNASIKSTEDAINEAERKRKDAEDAHDDAMEKYYAGNKSNYEDILKDFQDNYDEIWNKILATGDYSMETGDTVEVFHKTGSHPEVSLVGTSTETYYETIPTNNTGTTISGGEGDDYVINEAKNFVYSYTVGDGNDTISGFNAASKLRISGGDYTASASGNDIVLKVDDGSITLKDTKGMILNINGEKAFKPAWTLNKTTATYGSAVENLITVKGVKSLDGISLKKKVVTVSDASLNKKKVTISDGYTLKLGKDVTNPATSKAWSLYKSTATYKQTTTAGYTLADNVINYSDKSVETLATIKGVKSLEGITLKKKVVTVSDASLNKKKVTVSDGYTLKLGSDVTEPATSKAWNLYKSTATYKQTTTAGYTLADNAITYSKKSVETLATVKGVTSTDGFKVSGKTIKLAGSGLASKVTVGGGYEFDFAKDYKEATISGSSDNDSITTRGKKISINGGEGNDSIKIFGSSTTVTGGKGNDSLWGSSYADNFIYSSGDGNDVIYGFDDKDTLTLDNLDFKASYKNDALTLKFIDGSITLKDFTATTFHINGDAYKINGSKLVRK